MWAGGGGEEAAGARAQQVGAAAEMHNASLLEVGAAWGEGWGSAENITVSQGLTDKEGSQFFPSLD